ncbi:FAD-dependent oxidoreductase [Agaribacterium sp. ZY112]|uniref:FAD-dependent oxidoreductase n=1 Tax=Agaribacterium sp. ZY112 TaxID=3233574 RepID=UPI003523E1C7
MSSEQHYDVVIIGAGILGSGIAQACALQGWSTLVLEKAAEPATGASSKSSKLIHGGLRYLESLQFKLVYTCLRERRLLCALAPRLVRLKQFSLPVYKSSSRSVVWVALGLFLYWALAGFRRDAGFSVCLFRAARRKAETLGLKTEGLRALFFYYDAQADDRALTKAVLKSAQKLNAQVRFSEQIKAVTKLKHGFRLNLQSGSSVITRSLVNAAGPWVQDVHALLNLTTQELPVSLVKGSHLLINENKCKAYYYLEAPQDKRPFFVLPWKGKLLLGTTESLSATADVSCTSDERLYLLGAHNYYFPNSQVLEKDVVASFSGVRVLPINRGASNTNHTLNSRSRDSFLWVDSDLAGYWAVCGGKLTEYRAIAELILPEIAASLKKGSRLKSTRRLLID